MQEYIHPRYADVPLLRARARQRIPAFAFEYLDGGCNAEINLRKNTDEIRKIQLMPHYLKAHNTPDLSVNLLGKQYALPFGISPIGLQGLMWPRASEILARAAADFNVPYVLSTVGTASIERIAELSRGNAWFQLYNPREEPLRNDLLRRAAMAGYSVLVILADVPTFGYRAKEIKNGLSIPPRMTLANLWQIATHPHWAMQTLAAGTPSFQTLRPYLPQGLSLRHLGLFMDKTFDGRLNEEKVKELRDKWPGKLVIKGLASESDVEKAIALGLDGIIVSNHGGRQLDNAEAAITSLQRISASHGDRITLMMDSGLRNGPDVACALASGAEFAFLGRTFMYGVAALGRRGGVHTLSMLKKQLLQVMNQLGCSRVSALNAHVVHARTAPETLAPSIVL